MPIIWPIHKYTMQNERNQFKTTYCYSIYVKFRKRQNYGGREQISGCQVLRVWGGLIGAALGSIWEVIELFCILIVMVTCLCICQTHRTVYKKSAFTVCQLKKNNRINYFCLKKQVGKQTTIPLILHLYSVLGCFVIILK